MSAAIARPKMMFGFEDRLMFRFFVSQNDPLFRRWSCGLMARLRGGK